MVVAMAIDADHSPDGDFLTRYLGLAGDHDYLIAVRVVTLPVC